MINYFYTYYNGRVYTFTSDYNEPYQYFIMRCWHIIKTGANEAESHLWIAREIYGCIY